MKNVYRLLLLAAALACMAGIFIFSSQNAEKSNHISIYVSEKIIANINNHTDGATGDLIWRFNVIVRKYAHFAMFFVFGAVSTAFFIALMPRKRVAAVLCAVVLCLAWAAADELHQLYVPGRTGQARDVLIDFSGAFFGAVLTLAVQSAAVKIKKVIKKRTEKRLPK